MTDKKIPIVDIRLILSSEESQQIRDYQEALKTKYGVETSTRDAVKSLVKLGIAAVWGSLTGPADENK